MNNNSGNKCDFQRVDVNHMKGLHPRSIGGETLCLQVLKQLTLDEKLRALGFNEKDIGAAIGNIIGRMIHPGSEREIHCWLQQHSALGELINHDYNSLSLDRLYKVADKLLKNKCFKMGVLLDDGDHTKAFGDSLYAVPLGALWS